ncbi:MAG: fibronectin type III domain-containing protein [Clostridia bacterium]|nr:fibronectin type III domain-containing protein [Clostridia bacterium]
MKKYLSIFFVCLLMLTAATPFCYGVSTVSFTTTNGSVYSLNKGGEFVFKDGTFNDKCKIKKENVKQFLVKPNAGYSEPIFKSGGKKITLDSTTYDLIKVKVNGEVFYDYFLSNQYLTVSAMNKATKEYVKLMYGTTSYTKIKAFKVYSVGKYTDIAVSFKKETTFPTEITATMGDDISSKLAKSNCTFKSSNTKAVTVDKNTGVLTVKSEGVSDITITMDGNTYTVKITILPRKVKLTELTTKSKSITAKWEKDENATGYILKIGDKEYTVNSPKTLSKTVKKLTKDKTYSVKVRAYKKSMGETIYGKWSSEKKIKVK